LTWAICLKTTISTHGVIDDCCAVAEIVRQRSGARFVISFGDDRFERFYYMLAREPWVRTLLISELWMVYDLGEPAGQSVRQ
jgi:hypothetical protein